MFPQTQTERRAFPRVPIRIDAYVRLSALKSLPCVIRDISKGGVMIELAGEEPLPQKFVLDIPGNISTRRLCELAWQTGAMVGLKFLAPLMPEPRTDVVVEI